MACLFVRITYYLSYCSPKKSGVKREVSGCISTICITERLIQQGLLVYPIEALKNMAEKIAGKPRPIEFGDRNVAIVEYRDGTVIDVIRQIVN
jgi:hypothetical protein